MKLDIDFNSLTIPECPWSYGDVLSMTPEQLHQIKEDSGLAKSVQWLIAFVQKQKIRARDYAEYKDIPYPYSVSEEESWNDAYSAYLESKYWKAFRLKAIHKAEGRCERCGGIPDALHVHHKHYHSLGRESLGDVMVVCEVCHKIIHGVYIDRS